MGKVVGGKGGWVKGLLALLLVLQDNLVFINHDTCHFDTV